VRQRTRRELPQARAASEPEQPWGARPGTLTVDQVRALQRSVGNAATVRLMRFTRVSAPGVPRKNGKYRFSQNGAYLVQPGAKSIYAHKLAKAPRSCEATGQAHAKSADYLEYAPSMSFITDCLHTAEEIIHGRQLAQGGDYTKVAGTGEAFGLSENENIGAAKKYQKEADKLGGKAPVNDGANPGVGQAFVIVDTTPKKNKSSFRYPYHAAGVIARDGDDAVTMEMFASDQDAMDVERGGEAPQFQMYGPGLTFHTAHSSEYATPVTIVIEEA
jgi:hypothetical protein